MGTGSTAHVAALRRLTRICQRLEALRGQQSAATAERDALLVELVGLGIRYRELSGATGLTAGRIAQLVARHRMASAESPRS